jgi:hypothetical protein
MEKSIYKNNLIKLNNGYLLETNTPKDSYQIGDHKIVFGSFFNKFDNHYIFQTFRQFLIVRKDKDKNQITPYTKNILSEEVSIENLFLKCLDNLEFLVKKDLTRIQIENPPEVVNQLIQDYSFDRLHAFIGNPIFNEHINWRTKK